MAIAFGKGTIDKGFVSGRSRKGRIDGCQLHHRVYGTGCRNGSETQLLGPFAWDEDRVVAGMVV